MGEESSVAVVVVEVEEVEPTVAEVAVVPSFAIAFPLELQIGCAPWVQVMNVCAFCSIMI